MCASGVCYYKRRAIQLKASGSEQRNLKAGGARHIKQSAASKQLYRLCLMEEKNFKHTPKIQHDQDINTHILFEYYWYQLWWYLALDECFICVLARSFMVRDWFDLQVSLISVLFFRLFDLLCDYGFCLNQSLLLPAKPTNFANVVCLPLCCRRRVHHCAPSSFSSSLQEPLKNNNCALGMLLIWSRRAQGKSELYFSSKYRPKRKKFVMF